MLFLKLKGKKKWQEVVIVVIFHPKFSLYPDRFIFETDILYSTLVMANNLYPKQEAVRILLTVDI